MDRKIKGTLFIILSAVAYGAMPIFARLAYRDGLNPISLLFFRFWIAGVVLVLMTLRKPERLPEKPVFLGLVAMGAVGFFGQSFLYYNALTLASIGLCSLLLYMYPALVALFGVLFFKEKINLVKILALLLAMTGGVLTVGSTGSGQLLGIFLAFSAAFMYSFYILFGNKLIQKTSAIQSSTVIILSVAMVYTLLVIWRGLIQPQTLAGWIGVLGVALVSTVVAQVTFMAGLARIGSMNSAATLTLEPLTAIVLSSLLFGERLAALQLLGGGLIMAAVLILSLHELNRKGKQPAEAIVAASLD